MKPTRERIILALVVFFVLLFVFGAWQRLGAGPPRTVVFAAGSKGGAYFKFAEQYQEILAQSGLNVTVLETKGSRENLQLLEDGKADIAFVQSGLKGESPEKLRSLGSVFYEPIWLFVKGQTLQNGVLGLKGKRIAIDVQGSGTREVAETLIRDNNLTNQITALPIGADQAKDMLLNDELDALFTVGSHQVEAIRELIHLDSVSLVDFKRAKAYSRYHSSLSAIPLFQGMLDLTENIPLEDRELLSTSANLIVTEDFHYALTTLVLQTAKKVHREPGPFSSFEEFPNPRMSTFPLLEEAESFYARGPSFFYRNLPFYAAATLDRLVILLVPLLTLLLPLGRILPPAYKWFLGRKLYKLQDRLTDIELESDGVTPEKRLDQLRQLEEELMDVKSLPAVFQNDVFLFQLRIERAREALEREIGERAL